MSLFVLGKELMDFELNTSSTGAVDALAVQYFGQFHRQEDLRHLGTSLYSQALVNLRNILQDYDKHDPVIFIIATVLLFQYEVGLLSSSGIDSDSLLMV